MDISGWGSTLQYVFKSSINSGVIAMLGGLVIVPVVSMFTKKPEGRNKMFECFEPEKEVKKEKPSGKSSKSSKKKK